MNTLYNPKNNTGELITWYSGDGESKKRIDFIFISEKRKKIGSEM